MKGPVTTRVVLSTRTTASFQVGACAYEERRGRLPEGQRLPKAFITTDGALTGTELEHQGRMCLAVPWRVAMAPVGPDNTGQQQAWQVGPVLSR